MKSLRVAGNASLAPSRALVCLSSSTLVDTGANDVECEFDLPPDGVFRGDGYVILLK